MTLLSTTLAALFLLNTEPAAPQNCTVHQVEGTTLYCCALANGLTCCAEALAEDGTVSGCGCSP